MKIPMAERLLTKYCNRKRIFGINQVLQTVTKIKFLHKVTVI